MTAAAAAPMPTVDGPDVETLADLIDLVRGPGWTGRVAGQWYDATQKGAQMWGAGVGSFVARDWTDEGEAMMAIARRCGLGDDGQPRHVHIGLRASHESRRYSRWVHVVIERQTVAAILAEGGAAPRLVSASAPAAPSEAARIAQLEAQLAVASTPNRTTVVDSDPFALMLRLQQMQTESAAQLRREMREMLGDLKDVLRPAGPSTTDPELHRKLGAYEALANVATTSEKASAESLVAQLAPHVAPLVKDIIDVVKQGVDLRRDEQQMRMAMWAKANGLPVHAASSSEVEG